MALRCVELYVDTDIASLSTLEYTTLSVYSRGIGGSFKLRSWLLNPLFPPFFFLAHENYQKLIFPIVEHRLSIQLGKSSSPLQPISVE